MHVLIWRSCPVHSIDKRLGAAVVIMFQVDIQSQRSRTALCESYVTGMGSIDLLLLLTEIYKHCVQGLNCCQAATIIHAGGIWRSKLAKLKKKKLWNLPGWQGSVLSPFMVE